MPELAPSTASAELSADWQCLGATVPGASHLRQGLPNQDSLAWFQPPEGLPLLLSVSDGHGSPHCFRSAIGSRLATEFFVEELKAFLAGSYGDELSLIKRLAEERLPRQITRRWQEAVLAHYQATPVTPAEAEILAEKKGPEALKKLLAQPLLIYGATLLGIAITADFILTLQLGDGEILEADAAGQIAPILPADERLFANETTSLCSEDAWRDWRCRFQVRTEAASPIFLLLTTDGYFNSFRERSGFYQVGTDLLAMLRSDGPVPIQADLPTWLSEATTAGSGDDATLLIAWSQTGLAKLPEAPPQAASEDAEDLSAAASPEPDASQSPWLSANQEF